MFPLDVDQVFSTGSYWLEAYQVTCPACGSHMFTPDEFGREAAARFASSHADCAAIAHPLYVGDVIRHVRATVPRPCPAKSRRRA